jgi:thiamine biosynthesis lipoprotein
LEVLRACGLNSALVNAGASSIAGFGAEDAEGWLIGVRHPASENQVLGTLRLRDAALSSSGSYERPLVIGGHIYNHIIDPRSGAPAAGALGTTVVTDSAMCAEVMSKMLLLLGCEAAFAHFDELNWMAEGLLLTETAEGQLAVQHSAGLTGFQLQ